MRDASTLDDAFIVPGASRVVVPAALRTHLVAKQGADDYACGMFALFTAARMLGTASGSVGTKVALGALDPADRHRIEARLPRIGLFEKDLRVLAAAVGLLVYRPNTHDVAQFQQSGWLWMAFVRVKFTAPDRRESYVATHYVLVVDHLASKGVLVIADPHPWNPSTYCVNMDTFEAAWHAAKKQGPPWAATLYPASNPSGCSR